MEDFCDVFHDCKPESRSSGFLGAALIDTIEPFKDAGLAFLRNSNSGILHDNGIRLHEHDHLAALFRIADSVIH